MKTWYTKFAFSGSVRRKTWKKLAALLSHQVSQRQALTMIRDRYVARKHPLGDLFSQVLTELDKGQSIDMALFRWIPNEEAMLIKGGATGGRLPEALTNCAELIEAREKIVSSVIAAVAYPILLLALLVILLVVLAFFVVPEMAQVSDPSQWDGAAGMLYSVSEFVASPWGVLLGLAAFMGLGTAFLSLPLWTGTMRIRFDSIPPWSIYRILTGSVWLFTLATLMRAGISIKTVLDDMLASGTLRPWLYERVYRIQSLYRSEGNFGNLLQNLNMNFPSAELAEELAIYSTLPNFHTAMYEIAREFLTECLEEVQQQAKILNAVLLLVIILVICAVGLSIGSIQEQLQNSMGGF